jgi:hypothetical protein
MKEFFNKELTIKIPKELRKKKKKNIDDKEISKLEKSQSEKSALIIDKENKYTNRSSECYNCPYRQYSWDYSWEKKLKQLYKDKLEKE